MSTPKQLVRRHEIEDILLDEYFDSKDRLLADRFKEAVDTLIAMIEEANLRGRFEESRYYHHQRMNDPNCKDVVYGGVVTDRLAYLRSLER